MKNFLWLALFALSCTTMTPQPQPPMAARTDWKDVEAVMGRSGAAQPGGVIRFGFPRSDLAVDVGGIRIRPSLALGSWAAFNSSMVMGDLVLTESEVNNVITALQAGGIDQSAVHNHLLNETPRVVYVHYEGHGDPVALARVLRGALERTGTPLAAPAASTPPPLDLPTADLDQILRATGKPAGGVDQFSIPRAETITSAGMEIPPSMGSATAINFQSTGSGRAVATGDFVLIATEVNPVIRALRRGNVSVTALHSHMLNDSPRLFFMHFWGDDDAVALARTLGSALDVMNVKR